MPHRKGKKGKDEANANSAGESSQSRLIFSVKRQLSRLPKLTDNILPRKSYIDHIPNSGEYDYLSDKDVDSLLDLQKAKLMKLERDIKSTEVSTAEQDMARHEQSVVVEKLQDELTLRQAKQARCIARRQSSIGLLSSGTAGSSDMVRCENAKLGTSPSTPNLYDNQNSRLFTQTLQRLQIGSGNRATGNDITEVDNLCDESRPTGSTLVADDTNTLYVDSMDGHSSSSRQRGSGNTRGGSPTSKRKVKHRGSNVGFSPVPDTTLVDFLMTGRHNKTRTPRSRSMSSSGGKANEVRRAVNRSPALKRQGHSLPALRLDGTKYREICNLTTHGFNPIMFRSVVYYGPLLLKTGPKKWRRVFGIVCGNSYMYVVDEDMANKPCKHATGKPKYTRPLMQLTILRSAIVPKGVGSSEMRLQICRPIYVNMSGDKMFAYHDTGLPQASPNAPPGSASSNASVDPSPYLESFELAAPTPAKASKWRDMFVRAAEEWRAQESPRVMHVVSVQVKSVVIPRYEKDPAKSLTVGVALDSEDVRQLPWMTNIKPMEWNWLQIVKLYLESSFENMVLTVSRSSRTRKGVSVVVGRVVVPVSEIRQSRAEDAGSWHSFEDGSGKLLLKTTFVFLNILPMRRYKQLSNMLLDAIPREYYTLDPRLKEKPLPATWYSHTNIQYETSVHSAKSAPASFISSYTSDSTSPNQPARSSTKGLNHQEMMRIFSDPVASSPNSHGLTITNTNTSSLTTSSASTTSAHRKDVRPSTHTNVTQLSNLSISSPKPVSTRVSPSDTRKVGQAHDEDVLCSCCEKKSSKLRSGDSTDKKEANLDMVETQDYMRSTKIQSSSSKPGAGTATGIAIDASSNMCSGINESTRLNVGAGESISLREDVGIGSGMAHPDENRSRRISLPSTTTIPSLLEHKKPESGSPVVPSSRSSGKLTSDPGFGPTMTKVVRLKALPLAMFEIRMELGEGGEDADDKSDFEETHEENVYNGEPSKQYSHESGTTALALPTITVPKSGMASIESPTSTGNTKNDMNWSAPPDSNKRNLMQPSVSSTAKDALATTVHTTNIDGTPSVDETDTHIEQLHTVAYTDMPLGDSRHDTNAVEERNLTERGNENIDESSADRKSELCSALNTNTIVDNSQDANVAHLSSNLSIVVPDEWSNRAGSRPASPDNSQLNSVRGGTIVKTTPSVFHTCQNLAAAQTMPRSSQNTPIQSPLVTPGPSGPSSPSTNYSSATSSQTTRSTSQSQSQSQSYASTGNGEPVPEVVTFDESEDSNSISIGELDRVLHKVDSSTRGDIADSLMRFYLSEGCHIEFLCKLGDLEIEHTAKPTTLFRGSSLFTKAMDYFMYFVGMPYIHVTLSAVINTICEPAFPTIDVGQYSNESEANLERSYKRMAFLLRHLIVAISSSLPNLPIEFRVIFAHLRESAITQFNFKSQNDVIRPVSAILILRFFSLAVVSPHLSQFQLVDAAPSENALKLMALLGKMLQKLANSGHFGDNEAYMVEMNERIGNEYKTMFLDFMGAVSQPLRPSEMSNSHFYTFEMDKARILCRLHRFMSNTYLDGHTDPVIVKLLRSVNKNGSDDNLSMSSRLSEQVSDHEQEPDATTTNFEASVMSAPSQSSYTTIAGCTSDVDAPTKDV
eukprot:CFRG5387T1